MVTCRTVGLLLTLSLLRGAPATLAQSGGSKGPVFAGAWKPTDPARSDAFFVWAMSNRPFRRCILRRGFCVRKRTAQLFEP